MIKRNPDREARLLAKWREGKSARQAAIETGTPEGSTYHYWAKFGRDPEKANRLAQSLKPSQQIQSQDIAKQTIIAIEARKAKTTYEKLMSQGKYEDAKASIEAQAAYEKYMASKASAVTSKLALYLSEPKTHESLIEAVCIEMIQNRKAAGDGDLTAIDVVDVQLTGFSNLIPANHLELMRNALGVEREKLNPFRRPA